jgi:hypothetical protein
MCRCRRRVRFSGGVDTPRSRTATPDTERLSASNTSADVHATSLGRLGGARLATLAAGMTDEYATFWGVRLAIANRGDGSGGLVAVLAVLVNLPMNEAGAVYALSCSAKSNLAMFTTDDVLAAFHDMAKKWEASGCGLQHIPNPRS